ncbi:MAG: nucleotidyl transferase AbiEii/AbiGii toxin family protein [Candidatus Omnitrophica bacterium]|nr:nucleotidyl transferase AbiEii/AbiGii toxin family protein [Candidatus Omnitrophota bacterium]
MLTLEYLLEEAKHNGLPIVKRRGIVREYLHVIILANLYRTKIAKSMFFTGGTALRYFYSLPRFSEDLDFDTPGLTLQKLKSAVDDVVFGLKKEGFAPEVSFEERGRLIWVELHFKDIARLYSLTDQRNVDVMIKLDIYQPKWKLDTESGVLSLYGYNFSAVLLHRAYLFSEKILALLNRGRGRDIYDTLYMLKRKFPSSDEVLKANKLSGTATEIILNRLEKFSKKELRVLANQIKPFLFKEDDVELVLNAHQYAKKFLS